MSHRCSCVWAALLLLLTFVAPAVAQEGANPAITPVDRNELAWWKQMHAEDKAVAARGDVDLLFLGDSITQGWANAGKAAWDKHYGKRKVANFGISGDRTEHVLWRIDDGAFEGINPRLIVLMIGTNNIGHGSSTPEQTAKGIAEILKRIEAKLPETKVLLLGVFPRSAKPGDDARQKVATISRLIQPLADWDRVHFLDIGHVFLEADGTLPQSIMPDGLHLSQQGYARWAEAIEFKVAELLGETQEGSVTLFDGKSLNGWTNAAGDATVNGWAVEDGMLTTSSRGDDLYTVESFDNFDFQVTWKVAPQANSGIFYRWATYPQGKLGPEYQIIDDQGAGLAPTAGNATGSNYALYAPPAHNPIRPAGEWNHTRIVARGRHVEHWLNGVRILAFTEGDDDWQQRARNSKFRGFTGFVENPATGGQFILQNYNGDKVTFRDFVLRKLDNTSGR